MFLNAYDLPELQLANPTQVLSKAASQLKLSEALKADEIPYNESGDGPARGEMLLFRESMERAEEIFNEIAYGKPTISIFRLGMILREFGLTITNSDVDDIVAQLEMKDAMDITFSEAIDIANFLASEN